MNNPALTALLMQQRGGGGAGAGGNSWAVGQLQGPAMPGAAHAHGNSGGAHNGGTPGVQGAHAGSVSTQQQQPLPKGAPANARQHGAPPPHGLSAVQAQGPHAGVPAGWVGGPAGLPNQAMGVPPFGASPGVFGGVRPPTHKWVRPELAAAAAAQGVGVEEMEARQSGQQAPQQAQQTQQQKQAELQRKLAIIAQKREEQAQARAAAAAAAPPQQQQQKQQQPQQAPAQSRPSPSPPANPQQQLLQKHEEYMEQLRKVIALKEAEQKAKGRAGSASASAEPQGPSSSAQPHSMKRGPGAAGQAGGEKCARTGSLQPQQQRVGRRLQPAAAVLQQIGGMGGGVQSNSNQFCEELDQERPPGGGSGFMEEGVENLQGDYVLPEGGEFMAGEEGGMGGYEYAVGAEDGGGDAGGFEGGFGGDAGVPFMEPLQRGGLLYDDADGLDDPQGLGGGFEEQDAMPVQGSLDAPGHYPDDLHEGAAGPDGGYGPSHRGDPYSGSHHGGDLGRESADGRRSDHRSKGSSGRRRDHDRDRDRERSNGGGSGSGRHRDKKRHRQEGEYEGEALPLPPPMDLRTQIELARQQHRYDASMDQPDYNGSHKAHKAKHHHKRRR